MEKIKNNIEKNHKEKKKNLKTFLQLIKIKFTCDSELIRERKQWSWIREAFALSLSLSLSH